MVIAFAMLGIVTNDFRASSERKFMPWLWLIVGGLFEVGFTTSLRFVDGFRNLPWTLAFLGSVAVSMVLLEVASRAIPMGTAYAVWGGIGAVGTVAVGILWFHEPSSIVRILLILAIVGAIAALRLSV
jgi:quaternary ammonium compound-resistance protein SugE